MPGMTNGTNGSEKSNAVFQIRDPRSFYGGIALVLFALIALWIASDLPGQRGFSLGPGTTPRLFAILLLLLGCGITVMGVLSTGPSLERVAIRGPLFVATAIVTFAATIRPLGLVVASFLTFVISGLASQETRWFESVIAAVVLTAFCAALFRYLLQLPFQLWPAISL